MHVGSRNLITDVPGLQVGQATDQTLKSGVTVLTADSPFVCGVEVLGGAPGTRETDLLEPDKLVEEIDALVLSGGSAFGLDAAGGVANMLRKQGRGYRVGSVVVPIVPAAIIFDLASGGKQDINHNPYQELGRQALLNCGDDFLLGSEGAGTGATSANLKGGIGSASVVLDNGVSVGALMVANPVGSAVHEETGQFWAAPYELDNEFGGRGVCATFDPLAPLADKRSVGTTGSHEKANTTIGIVATDARLTKAQAKRLAVSAHDGLSRSLLPSHTPFDGDLIFSVSTGEIELHDANPELLQIGHHASLCVARAIARAIYHAESYPGDVSPTWAERWGG